MGEGAGESVDSSGGGSMMYALQMGHPCSVLVIPARWFFFLYIYKFIYLFIYFWLHWVFVAVRRLSLAVASGGYSSLRCAGFSLSWLLSLQSTGSGCQGFSSCGTWAR